MKKIAIIGAGGIGRAIGELLKDAPTKVSFWDADPSRSTPGMSLEDMLREADLVFLCVPSSALPRAIKEIKPVLRRGSIVVNLAKGFTEKKNEPLDAFLKKELPGQRLVFISGPMLAGELSEKGGAALAASSSASARKAVYDLFRPTKLAIQASSDVRGTALIGVLKNIYVLALGAADGLDLGWNAKGYLTGAALEEMADMLPRLGGRRTTAISAVSVGDLVATGMCADSKNHAAGKALAMGLPVTQYAEGVHSVPLVKKRIKNTASLPLFRIIETLLSRPKDGSEKLREFAKGR